MVTDPGKLALSNTIANTIVAQIGRGAFYMINAKDHLTVDRGLRFSVVCRGSKANRVTITLDGDDTYTVRCSKYSGGRMNYKTMTHSGPSEKPGYEISGIYAGQLKVAIEKGTGLALSL